MLNMAVVWASTCRVDFSGLTVAGIMFQNEEIIYRLTMLYYGVSATLRFQCALKREHTMYIKIAQDEFSPSNLYPASWSF